MRAEIPGNGSFDGVKVSWRENSVVVRIAVLLVGAGMAPFVSRNRRGKSCQHIETWVFLSAPVPPTQLGVMRTFHTTPSCISLPPV